MRHEIRIVTLGRKDAKRYKERLFAAFANSSLRTLREMDLDSEVHNDEIRIVIPRKVLALLNTHPQDERWKQDGQVLARDGAVL